jgi:hypothetical protein
MSAITGGLTAQHQENLRQQNLQQAAEKDMLDAGLDYLNKNRDQMTPEQYQAGFTNLIGSLKYLPDKQKKQFAEAFKTAHTIDQLSGSEGLRPPVTMGTPPGTPTQTPLDLGAQQGPMGQGAPSAAIQAPQVPQPGAAIAPPSPLEQRLQVLKAQYHNPGLTIGERSEIISEQKALVSAALPKSQQHYEADVDRSERRARLEQLRPQLTPEQYQRSLMEVEGFAGPGVFTGMGPRSMGTFKQVAMTDPQGQSQTLLLQSGTGKYFKQLPTGEQVEVPVTPDWKFGTGQDRTVKATDENGHVKVINLSALNRGEPVEHSVHDTGIIDPRYPMLPTDTWQRLSAGGFDPGQALALFHNPRFEQQILLQSGGTPATGAPRTPQTTPRGTVPARTAPPAGQIPPPPGAAPISPAITPDTEKQLKQLEPALSELRNVKDQLAKEPDSNNPISSWLHWQAYLHGIATSRSWLADVARTDVQATSPYLGGRQAVLLQQLIMKHLPEPTDSITLAKIKTEKAIRGLETMEKAALRFGTKGMTAAQAQAGADQMVANTVKDLESTSNGLEDGTVQRNRKTGATREWRNGEWHLLTPATIGRQ